MQHVWNKHAKNDITPINLHKELREGWKHGIMALMLKFFAINKNMYIQWRPIYCNSCFISFIWWFDFDIMYLTIATKLRLEYALNYEDYFIVRKKLND